jgi:hypothetical protein
MGLTMLGVQDFIGYYDWTFEYLCRNYGEAAVHAYWAKPNLHLLRLFSEQGFGGMYRHWHHTLEMEEAGYHLEQTGDYFRIDMADCPSKGYLIRHDLAAYHDYCEHCIGWIKPLLDATGFVVNHEHNHTGQCYWEMHRADSGISPGKIGPEPPPIRGAHDVRLLGKWQQRLHHLYLNSQPVCRGEVTSPKGRSGNG